jgi:DNA-binding XRE family transcriptional regulator
MDSIPGMRGVPLSEEQRTLLIARRNEIGLTQLNLAKKIGLKGAITIHTIEAGKFLPSPKVLEKMCKNLSLDCNVMIDVHLSNADTAVNSRIAVTIYNCKKSKSVKTRKRR